MLHLPGGVALGVDVADLLELQRPLEGHREEVAAPEVEHARALVPGPGDLEVVRLLGQLRLYHRRDVHQRRQLRHHRRVVEAPEELAELQREQVHRRQLRRERLGRRHPDLRAGVGVQRPLTLPRDGRPDDVADADDPRPTALRLPQRSEGVGGLPTLRDGEDERPVIHRRVAVAKLARDLDVGGQAGEILKQIAAHEPGVPGRPAADDIELAQAREVVRGDGDLGQVHRLALEGDAAPQRVRDGARLLVDLLEHEVLVAALLGHRRRPRDGRLLPARRLVRRDHADVDGVGRQDRHPAVLDEHHVAGVGEDGRDVARQVVGPLAEAEHQRARHPRADDHTRGGRVDDHDRVRAVQAQHRLAHRLGQREPVRRAVVVDQVRDDLGVRLALKHVAERAQLGLELDVVLDDAVVDDGHRPRPVRVCVVLGRRPVGRPAGVPHAGAPVDGRLRQALDEVRELPLGPPRQELPVPVHHREPSRVIAAILEPPQPVDDELRAQLRSHVPHDATHQPFSSSLAAAAAFARRFAASLGLR